MGSRPLAIAVDGQSVYLGGDFTAVMAGMPQDTFLRIARWDGQAWSRLGDGLDGPVRALCVVPGPAGGAPSVVVGGEFAVAGGSVAASRLARWDSERWSDVGGGVSHAEIASMAVVRAITTDGRYLYVAGLFDRAGRGNASIAANGLAAFDTQTGTWRGFGSGLTHLGSSGEGRALLLDGEQLYVGGAFDSAGDQPAASLACVNLATGQWSAFGAGIRDGEFTGQVNALARDPATAAIYVGGSFTAADIVPASGVVRLDSSGFTALGEFTFYGNPATASVRGLAVCPARDGGPALVYAGGEFTQAGNSASANLVVHVDGQWTAPWGDVDNVVTALAALPAGDEAPCRVVVAGDFVSSGGLRITHAGIWTGQSWQTFGQGVSYDPYADGNVFAILSDSAGGAIAGGYFDQAGPVRCGSLARWTGTDWDAMSGGIAAAGGLGTVYALARIGTDVYVTGTFSSAGSVAAANIARWDGTTWSALGSGLNGTGYALARLGDRLVVGGAFTAAGMTSASGVAVWDPQAQTWAAVGNAPVYDDDVLALAVIADRYLVIAGEFTAFRHNNRDVVRGLNAMVLFDTQAPIDPQDVASGYFLAAGVKRASGTGRVRALQVLGEDLYVGGWFDTAGVLELADPPEPGFAAANLAVWHFGADASWSTPGGADQPVQAFTTLEGSRLVVAGHFHLVGPQRAGGVAEYDPATGVWTTYGTGLGEGLRGVLHGEALAQDATAGLWVGGTFNTAGGRPSCSVALWAGTAGQKG